MENKKRKVIILENISYLENKLHDIPVESVVLEGKLSIPERANGIVIFAHGSGSSRKSPRNNCVAEYLHGNNIGSLLFDLLTEKEDLDYSARFNIPLLTERLIGVTKWLQTHSIAKKFNFGYFGASTGAASALSAAATFGDFINAVVSRGGRVDMASEVLGQVESPTQFIVGGNDHSVLKLNREAYEKLNCLKDLKIIKGAGHLFEGKIEQVAETASNWFEKYLPSP